MPTASQGVLDGARAIAAIEAYAALHNLQAVDMPSLGTLIDAVIGGTALKGSKLTDADVGSLLDEQMRIHFRTLGARTSMSPAGGPGLQRVD